MVMDYRERKPIQNASERKALPKNKPRREQPIGLIAVLSVVALLVSFGAGVFTGWFLFKGRKPAAAVAAPAQAPKKGEAPSAAKSPPGNEPLTFYQTLPAGGKGALGSGLNLKKEEKKAAPPAAPAAASSTSQEAPPGRFVVQVASYREKKEADATQEKLSSKGVAAYVVEVRTAEKGTWYRVRVGKHLSREDADELAGTAGQGAIVVAE